MALHEERSELMSEQWLSRLAKQRHDLSASVEAALIDETVQERELQDEQDDEIHTGPDGVVIPPRLSLQSRVMPVVGNGGLVEATATYPVVSQKATGKQQVLPTEQPSGRLARLAQRITSSLATFGFAMRPEALVLSEEEKEAEVPEAIDKHGEFSAPSTQDVSGR